MASATVSQANGHGSGRLPSPELANGVGPGRDSNRATDTDRDTDSDSNIYNASSVAAIRAALSQLQDREALVTARLDALVASQKDLSRELGRLDLLRAHLGTQASTARAISHEMLSGAASSAHTLSSAVRRLDLEQSRVRSILDMVGQVAELKACVLGVAGSMGASQNWEMAASYMHRASKIPEDVVNSPFAAEIVPTAEVPDTPSVTLSSAAESLCALFLREFEHAVKENDGAKITRFFKLFPLIGKSDVGLDVYGRYVCQGVAARARSNLNAGTGGAQAKDDFFYANALTRLFEHIAQIVDAHGALVERHYGPGKMGRVVERLQVEADVQGGIILESWAEERHVDRRLTDIKSYAFTFLVQSFLPGARGAAGTPRSNSPASWDTPQRNSEDEGVDMKEIDSILNEISVMLGRWSLYGRFLASKCREDGADDDDLELPSFLTGSPLSQKVDTKLLSPYNAMTTFFLRRSVEKAFQLDEAPVDLTLDLRKPLVSNSPHITSVVDDIMYIVNKVIQQTLATSQRSAVTSVVPTIARVLGADFIGMVHRKMRDETHPRPVVPGGQPPAATVVSFLVLVNNLDVAVDYLERIVKRHMESTDTGGDVTSDANAQPRISMLFPLADDAQVVLSTLRSLSATFTSKAQDLIGDGIQVIFNNVLKSRLRPILADAFRDTEYQPQDGEGEDGAGAAASVAVEDDVLMHHHEAGHQSLVRQRFAAGWRDLMLPIARILTGNTFDRLLGVTLASLSRLLEKRLWSYHGRVNALGTTRLERDVTGIIAAAVDVAESQGQHPHSAPGERGGGGSSIGGRAGRYRHRETFARCAQIVMIMGMEEEEWEEISQADGDVVDKLSVEERARARSMVI
ncbi:oligomeric Golgi complex component 4 [Nannizzia gypsea CBS 118893]|uniref:Conserved oligomeric Golgi complex subunit 4 n=1 Tax=Arthroderma gypseum (strain ATCC MYA-4604 / CBS 118893) TaxID=535722 RepID=E4UP45_ARTGP|nr:oligomeric Golgi complex component 4 [Nannizzia gypsea CBS 118893]EFQ98987.1 oligomeric Golgi complex component 4 [Nannizzia gypsea CBS 118893]